MSSAPPTTAPGFAGDALVGAVFGGIVVPLFQYFLLELLDAVPRGTVDSTTFTLFLAAIVMIGLLPFVSTLISMAATYAVGGPIGLGLYIVMSTAASAVLNAPLMGIIVLLVSLLAMMLWLLLQTRQQTPRRGMY